MNKQELLIKWDVKDIYDILEKMKHLNNGVIVTDEMVDKIKDDIDSDRFINSGIREIIEEAIHDEDVRLDTTEEEDQEAEAEMKAMYKEYKREKATEPTETIKDGEGGCIECGAALNNAESYGDSGKCPKCYVEGLADVI
jgi:hypothetical protein